MIKRFVLIVALFIALTSLAVPTQADCDPKDPDCPITPPQSVEVNSDVILDDAATGDVDSPGALIPLESDFSSSGPEIINPLPFNSILAAPPNFESLDVRMRWQEPTDVSCGVQALGMAFDGIGDGSPSSSEMQGFLQSKGMMYDFGTGVEELAYAAQNFGYKGSVPFHGWALTNCARRSILVSRWSSRLGLTEKANPGISSRSPVFLLMGSGFPIMIQHWGNR